MRSPLLPAHVQSVDALREAKAAIDWFLREAAGAIAEADSELQRTQGWLEREALPHWERELKKRHALVNEARSEFYRQQLIANPNTPTALQQRKAWDRAKQAVLEAEDKRKRVRAWIVAWEREAALYKGAMAQLGEAITHDLPTATARINRLVEILEQYAALRSRADTAAAMVGASVGTPSEELSESESSGATAESPDLAAALNAELPDAFALLRERTPPAGLRALTSLTDPAMIAATNHHPLHPRDLETLSRLALPALTPDDDDRVSLRSGALVAPSIYLERTAPARPGDSGWFIGSAGGIMGHDLHAIPCWLLRLKRPDLLPLLSLPIGSLVVLGAEQRHSRVLALLDHDNTDLWPAPAADAAGDTEP